MNPECIFCRIVAKREVASVFYDDDLVMGFMDIRPINPGTCLIIPKDHVDHFTDLPENVAQRITSVALRVGRKIRDVFKPTRVGMVVHGFGVPHAHLIVVPQHDRYDITSRHFAVIKDGRIAFEWDRLPLANRAELDAQAKMLETT